MSKTIIAIIIIIVIVGLGYWIYQLMTTPEELTEKEQACINSGGEVSTSLCCKATGDFPNLCLIGPCGCSPENSHQVKICDCGPDKCFNGSECVSSDEILALLENLNQETGIDFSEIQNIEFKWIVKVDPEITEEIVVGKGFEANVISNEQYDSIEQFLKDNGFKTDVYNIAAGTISESTGYKKDKAVCAVAGGLTGYKEAEGPMIMPEADKWEWDITVKCGKLEKTEMEYATEDWQIYESEKYGYSFKYPTDCLFGPLPGYCKLKPPEERPRECRCFLDGTNLDSILMQTFTGTKSDLTLAEISVSHHFTDLYNPPAGTDLVSWLKEKFPHQDVPDEINMEIDGIPAVKVYTPLTPGVFPQEDTYFIKNDKLFKISMLDVDNEDNKTLYSQILFTFDFSE
ncbi:MAG: hypothetical protein ACKKMO_01160 [Candidatus Nealsonbacteria bacterium]